MSNTYAPGPRRRVNVSDRNQAGDELETLGRFQDFYALENRWAFHFVLNP